MLALMHQADPYGHLLVYGNAPTDEQLAVLAGAPPSQVPDLLVELEKAGVFSRTRTGTIYSRRMTREERARKDGARAAREGTLPTSRRGKQASGKKQEKPPPQGVDGGVAGRPPSPQKLEAISQASQPGDDVYLIRAFDEIRKHFWPNDPRPNPAGNDLVVVRRWLADGATFEPIRALFEARMRTMSAANRSPPSALSYFENAVRDLLGRSAA